MHPWSAAVLLENTWASHSLGRVVIVMKVFLCGWRVVSYLRAGWSPHWVQLWRMRKWPHHRCQWWDSASDVRTTSHLLTGRPACELWVYHWSEPLWPVRGRALCQWGGTSLWSNDSEDVKGTICTYFSFHIWSFVINLGCVDEHQLSNNIWNLQSLHLLEWNTYAGILHVTRMYASCFSSEIYCI